MRAATLPAETTVHTLKPGQPFEVVPGIVIVVKERVTIEVTKPKGTAREKARA